MSNRRMILVRHGRTLSNELRRYAGASDEPLDDTGREQARAVARLMAAESPVSIVASPVRRAVETAKIVAEHCGVPFSVNDRFSEIVMGPWTGLTENQVAERYVDEWALWNTNPSALRLAGRETLDELLARAQAGLAEVRAAHPLGTIGVVTHVAVIRVLWLASRNLPLDLYRTVDIPNCQPFALPF